MTAYIEARRTKQNQTGLWIPGFGVQERVDYEHRSLSPKMHFGNSPVLSHGDMVVLVSELLSEIFQDEDGFTKKEWVEIIRGMEDFAAGRFKQFTDVEELISYLHSDED